MSEDLVALVRGARFTRTRLRLGYDPVEVDAFLDRLVSALADGRPVRALADEAAFSVRSGRTGYDMRDVDALLDTVAAGSTHPEDQAGASPEGGARPEVLRWIQEFRFVTTRAGRLGYDTSEVDRFVDELLSLLRRGEPIAEVVRAVQLEPGRHLQGYDVDDVEIFLAALVRQLEGVDVRRAAADGPAG